MRCDFLLPVPAVWEAIVTAFHLFLRKVLESSAMKRDWPTISVSGLMFSFIFYFLPKLNNSIVHKSSREGGNFFMCSKSSLLIHIKCSHQEPEVQVHGRSETPVR